MHFLGVDGCNAGWLGVQLDENGQWDIGVVADALALWHRWATATLILIDIPIGLPDKSIKSRSCDREARRLLGRPRRSSVFPAPARACLGVETYAAACVLNQAEIGTRLSLEAYGITRKIKQMDDLMRQNNEARQKIRETHPEICFWALNNRQAMQHMKKSEAGYRERLAVLQRFFSRSQEIIDYALRNFQRKAVGRDDILDALVVAMTGLKPDELVSIPATPELDACGLRMEIVYRGIIRSRIPHPA